MIKSHKIYGSCIKTTHMVALMLFTIFSILLHPYSNSVLLEAASLDTNYQVFNYEDYETVLETYVDDRGMVNYRKLKENREKIDKYINSLGKLDPKVYDKWSAKEKIAFWINSYNSITLHVIFNNYPIKPSFFSLLRFPANSIRQIPGVWDKLKFPVMGRMMTLNDIEHNTLRKEFNEPRIHMALVCAAMGCPPLRNEPYMSNKLDDQLNDQARKFLSNPMKFHIERAKERVYLSPIFKWFGEDFIKTYGTEGKFTKYSQAERAVLNFISSYFDKKDANFLTTGKYDIEYLDYDWSLNEQKGKK